MECFLSLWGFLRRFVLLGYWGFGDSLYNVLSGYGGFGDALYSVLIGYGGFGDALYKTALLGYWGFGDALYSVLLGMGVLETLYIECFNRLWGFWRRFI